MTRHVMSAESATTLLGSLHAGGVDACVGGGWAVDALLREQTREHSDLDLWVAAESTNALFAALAACGVDRVFPWPGDRPWNFVLHDGDRLRVDLHFYEPLAEGSWHYGSASAGYTFPLDALSGAGEISGMSVRCEAPEWSVRFHTGYPPRAGDRLDVGRLCERYGLPVPQELR